MTARDDEHVEGGKGRQVRGRGERRQGERTTVETYFNSSSSNAFAQFGNFPNAERTS